MRLWGFAHGLREAFMGAREFPARPLPAAPRDIVLPANVIVGVYADLESLGAG